ncbi:hypothetical protein SMD22_01405 (plasmid) [Brevibacillus halotolerans]|nr:hypothetical protein SMD22_01405 [Brevibacillus halotolerans]
MINQEKKLVKCDRCRFCSSKMDTATIDIYYICRNEKMDLSQVKDMKAFELECDSFESKYIEYPLEINGINKPEGIGIQEKIKGLRKTGSLVMIRPCAKEYGDRTYLGFYLGYADVRLLISHCSETKNLNIMRDYNPAIFVPDLGKIIYGMESYWGFIENEEELRDITDDDIDNLWYVKALRRLSQQEKP